MRMHLVLGKRPKRRLRKAEVPVCASDIETMPLTPPHVQPTLERKPTPQSKEKHCPTNHLHSQNQCPRAVSASLRLGSHGCSASSSCSTFRWFFSWRLSCGGRSPTTPPTFRRAAHSWIRAPPLRGVHAFARLLPRVDSALGCFRLLHLPSSARLL